MKLNLKKTYINAYLCLVPADEDTLEALKKFSKDETYTSDFKRRRNNKFHRRYFARLKMVWEWQDFNVQEHFHFDFDCFRDTVEETAGCTKVVFSIKRKEWVEEHKSIAFDSMPQEEFEKVDERVNEVLRKVFCRNDEYRKMLDIFNNEYEN